MPKQGSSGASGFWSSLPGFLTGLAALVTACGGIYALTRDRDGDGPAAAAVPANLAGPTNQAAPPDPAAAPKTYADAGNTPPETGAPSPPPEAAPPSEEPNPLTCRSGFVWRDARDGDAVCVTPETRAETAAENRMAASRHLPDSATCVSGYVWREAFDGDTVCVEPAIRARAHADNRAAASRVAR